MRAREIIREYSLLLLLILPFLGSSCSSDNAVVTINDYCYIRSVTLGLIKRQTATQSSTFAGSLYEITVNQRTGIIENRDSLPFGSKLQSVIATISFDGSLLLYRDYKPERPSDDDTGWLAYVAIDSLDLTKPLQLKLFSNDSKSERTYIFKVNVHQQEGDSLCWKHCEDTNTELLASMTDMKAFALNDRLMVLGQKSGSHILAERTEVAQAGTWTESSVTGLPAAADLQTLCQQNGTLYLSTLDGRIFSSTDALSWQQTGAAYHVPLTLVKKTDDYFYAVSTTENKLLRSADAADWTFEDKLDTKADSLPDASIRALTLEQANGNTRIVMVGHKNDCAHAIVWNKMWNESEKEQDAEWIFFPYTPDNTLLCPRLANLNLLSYDGKCIAFGGASADDTHQALDAVYVSRDYGITWRPGAELYLPPQLKGYDGCITSAVDRNNFIWIITNAQVWRGRLNRLGFAQQ